MNRMNSSDVLSVEGLIKQYGPRRVVNGVSFHIQEGEVVGLLGLNGAGKTTSFRMTSGLIPADQGHVFLNGIDVSEWPMYRRAKEGRMGYLPQDRSVFASLTTAQNMYIMAELIGLSRSEQKKRCQQLIKEFRLEDLKKTRVGMGGTGGLSGGERRRLEFARALLSDPRILLLDEPFANVDPPTVKEIQQVIIELSKKGIAFLITDHQVQEVLEIANRIYVIDKGEVLCSGTAAEVLANDEAQERYFCRKSEVPNQEQRPYNASPAGATAGPSGSSGSSAGGTSNQTFRSVPVKETADRPRNEDQGYVVPDSAPVENNSFRVRSPQSEERESRRPLGRKRTEEFQYPRDPKSTDPSDPTNSNRISNTFRKKQDPR
ncbi:MAG: LPS export ABC transporter ATP-binding protein [Planctomycetia bacterium]|nr:LPS export ABC transporter ATP-binding protein [Planctomycetia bacterium]